MPNLWRPCANLAILTIAFWHGAALAESNADRGLALATRWCNSCHVVQQKDPGMDDGEFGPPFATLTEYSPEMLKNLFAKGHADMVRSANSVTTISLQ